MTQNAINALSHGFMDAGCGYVSNYPGSFSHDMFHAMGGVLPSLNEKIAYESAYGASLSGIRSAVFIKNAGFNIAADPFLNSLISGVNAGLVLIVTDDTEMTGSQTPQDSRSYIDFWGGLWFEPNSMQKAYDIAYDSFAFSEKFDVPIVIRLTNQFFSLAGEYERKPVRSKKLRMAHDLKKYVIHPTTWKGHEKRLEKKNRSIRTFVEGLYTQKISRDDRDSEKIIAVGNCQKETLSVLKRIGKKRPVALLNIFTYPLPLKMIARFIGNSGKVTILEEGSDFVRRQLLPYVSGKIFHNGGRKPDLSHTYLVYDGLEKLFSALKRVKPDCVIGDVGQYTRETKGVVGSCLSYGSSVAVAMGVNCSSGYYPFCIVGDGAFSHSSILSLREAVFRKANMCLIVIDNGGMRSTSNEKVPTDIYALGLPLKADIIEYGKTSTADLVKKLRKIKSKKELSLVYVRM